MSRNAWPVSRARRLLLLATVAFLASSVTGCGNDDGDGETSEEVSEPAAQTAGTSQEDLLAAEVPWRWCGEGLDPVQLVDGAYGPEPDPRLPEEAAAMVSLWVVGHEEGEPVAITEDMTGDGTEEGLLLVAENCGGSGTGVSALVYSGQELLSELPTDGAVLSSASVQDGELVLTGMDYGPEDPNCCPSVEVELRFVWDGEAFNRAG